MPYPLNNNTDILVLPSWYPSNLDVFAGDFVKRHVEAISLLHRQHVIFVVKDEHGVITKSVLETRNEFENYTEVIIYYHIKKIGIRILDKIRSDKKYFQLYKKYLKKYIREKGIANLCHVHVAMKAGLAALWLKKRYNIPFLVTEHWSSYLPEAIPRFADYNQVFQQRIRKILSNADAVTAVSAHLATSIHNLIRTAYPIVVPNVVDMSIFYPRESQQNKPFRFIHASTMTYPKNIEKIFESLRILKSSGYGYTMDIFGPVQHGIVDLINKMSLHDHVSLRGDVSQTELAMEMKKADALIQFSKFETFSCVVIEANAVGIPVFASDIPALRELITDNKNGYLIKADDCVALAGKLMAFIDGKLPVDKDAISISAQKFSYTAVAKRFSEVYSNIINGASFSF